MKKLGLPSLEYRRTRADLLQTFKIKRGHDIMDTEWLLPKPTRLSQTLRGNSEKIHKGRARTEVRRSIFSQRVVDPWNSLPEEIIKAPSINAFKNRLNNHWVAGARQICAKVP